MNGVAIVIYVNMTMSCLYQNVPYMYSKYPLLWTIENKKRLQTKQRKHDNQNNTL